MKRYHVDPSHYRASLTYEDDNGAWVRWEDTESLREEIVGSSGCVGLRVVAGVGCAQPQIEYRRGEKQQDS